MRSSIPSQSPFGLAVLFAVLAGCAPARPSSSDYLGKWEGTVETLTGGEGRCHLDISAVGKSLVIKSERQRIGNCQAYEGIWVLTPEGNLKGGPMGSMLISYDKTSKQAIVSGLGHIRYLHRPTQDELDAAFFSGTWSICPGDAGCPGTIGVTPRVFRLEIQDNGAIEYCAGHMVPPGIFACDNRWNTTLSNGVLSVSFAEGSAKITRASDKLLSYEESDAFAPRKLQAERIEWLSER